MKEVSCNGARECRRVEAAVFGERAHWCHAAHPHFVTESCERSYCVEAHRQVQCKVVPERAPLPNIDYKGIPPRLRWIGWLFAEHVASLPPEIPDTITDSVYKSTVRALILEEIRHHVGQEADAWGEIIASHATEYIIQMPRIRQEGGTGE